MGIRVGICIGIHVRGGDVGVDVGVGGGLRVEVVVGVGVVVVGVGLRMHGGVGWRVDIGAVWPVHTTHNVPSYIAPKGESTREHNLEG